LTGYAVVDVETTGLHPSTAEIVEVAVVHVDASGGITDRWDTLVRPLSAVSGTRVHGITATMVREAPRFADIAGHLQERLAGRVAVAHNLPFDSRFLAAQFGEAGIVAAHIPLGVCTLRLARSHLPGPAFKLPDCCAQAEIVLTDAHSALGDATATARLLGFFISRGVKPGGTPAPTRTPVPRRRLPVASLSRPRRA
jgi:DNA polymerase III subunit epsilon